MNTTQYYTNTLREHRLKYKLLQAEVASLLGFKGIDRISLWEQGKNVPNIVNLFKLCVLFRVQPFDLYPYLADYAENQIEGEKDKILSK